MMGLKATSSKRAYATPSALLTQTPAGDTQTQFWLSLCGLGVCFVPFPCLSNSDNQVLGAHTVPGGPCILITSPVLAAQCPRCTRRALTRVHQESTDSDVLYVSSGELISG